MEGDLGLPLEVVAGGVRAVPEVVAGNAGAKVGELRPLGEAARGGPFAFIRGYLGVPLGVVGGDCRGTTMGETRPPEALAGGYWANPFAPAEKVLGVPLGVVGGDTRGLI